MDPTGAALRGAGIRRAGLLGTRYTMELPFWRERLADRFGIELIVPEAEERAVVHLVIYEELCRGQVVGSSRDAYAGIITRLSARGTEAVVLGCTEISLLVKPADVRVPLFDTTALHVEAALEFATRRRAGDPQ